MYSANQNNALFLSFIITETSFTFYQRTQGVTHKRSGLSSSELINQESMGSGLSLSHPLYFFIKLIIKTKGAGSQLD